MADLVRHAVPDDEEPLFDALRELHRTGLGRPFPYDYGKTMAAIQYGTRHRGGIIGVIDAPGRSGYIAATVGLLLEEWWWSKCAFLQERWFFVRPSYRRGTGYADALKRFSEGVRVFIQTHSEQKEPIVLESSFVQADPRRMRLMDRFYGRWGRRVGGVYVTGLRRDYGTNY